MSPANLVKAGFVQVDTATGVTTRTIAFQYNPDTLTRRLDAVDPNVEPRETVADDTLARLATSSRLMSESSSW